MRDKNDVQVAVSNIYSALTSDGSQEELQHPSCWLQLNAQVSLYLYFFSPFGSAADVCELWSGGNE